ncbi:hypothetical protein OG604_05055 [Streptomyces sp. NBC_01231]|nr:hypothetical protein OG604_05055 [Streptomyces sp. NBC_01231]
MATKARPAPSHSRPSVPRPHRGRPARTAGDWAAPRATGGDLAETGTQLWPAAAGAVLLIWGFRLLLRTRRNAG